MDVLKTGLRLLIFSCISVLLLSIVYLFTAPEIEKINKQREDQTKKELLGFNLFFEEVKNIPGLSDKVYMGKEKGNPKPVGWIIKTIPKTGYSGRIDMYIGIKNDPLKNYPITQYKILNHNETPGLGTKAIEGKFHDSFNYTEKNWVDYTKLPKSKSDFKQKLNIDTISGATITSMAVVDGIKLAYKQLILLLKNDEDTKPDSEKIEINLKK